MWITVIFGHHRSRKMIKKYICSGKR